jgi:hypothetical protein
MAWAWEIIWPRAKQTNTTNKQISRKQSKSHKQTNKQTKQHYQYEIKENNFPFNDWLWAWQIIWSRAFDIPVFQKSEKNFGLVPLADLLNHQNEAKVRN